jgi:hypothetical protein
VFDERDPNAKDPEPTEVLEECLFDEAEFASLLARRSRSRAGTRSRGAVGSGDGCAANGTNGRFPRTPVATLGCRATRTGRVDV